MIAIDNNDSLHTVLVYKTTPFMLVKNKNSQQLNVSELCAKIIIFDNP